MPKVFLSDKALSDFMYWAHNDRKILDKINSLPGMTETARQTVSASPNASSTKTVIRGESTTNIA